jgi:hypothetical protein
MSDNARRFMTVRKHLIKSYPGTTSRRLVRHLTTLSGLVAGIVGAGTTHLSKIAQRVPDKTKAESRLKRFSRLLNSEETSFERYYLPWARQLAASLSQGRPLVLVFDGSAVGRGAAMLMASVVYRRRALPLVWTTRRGKKGSFSLEDHLDLVEALKAILPKEASVIVLGDGEFDALELQRALDEAGWHYVCRTSRAKRVSDGFTEGAIGELAPFCGERYAWLPGATMTASAYGPVQVIVWHEARYAEPLFLVTNLDLAEEALYWYRRRFRIETMFSDQKSRGFHVHKSHISDPKRLSRLLVAVSLAYLWVVYLGAEALRQGYHRCFHRGDRVDLSLFQLGLRLLEYLLNEGKRIPVAFVLSPAPQNVR